MHLAAPSFPSQTSFVDRLLEMKRREAAFGNPLMAQQSPFVSNAQMQMLGLKLASLHGATTRRVAANGTTFAPQSQTPPSQIVSDP